MKTLTASKVVAVAACSSTTAVATAAVGRETSLPFLPIPSSPSLSTDTTTTSKTATAFITSRLPRGGGDQDSDDNPKDDSTQKPKQHPRQKKKRHRPKKSPTKDGDDDEKNPGSDTSKEESTQKNKTTPQKSADKDKNGKGNKVLEEILSQEDYYQVLGISRSSAATEVVIKKAYRKRAVQTHPDKTGGDRRAFDKVAEAYDVLIDPQKRKLYDTYGKAGLDPTNGPGGPSMNSYQDLFRNMFQQQQQHFNRRQTNQTVRYQLQVSLEDLYRGTTQSVVVTPPRSREHKKTVRVDVPKGSRDGQRIVLSGEMDFDRNETPGDLIFVLTQVPHPRFTRNGHDLAMELTISLEEAVCGYVRRIRHLNGSQLWIESARSSVDGVNDVPIVIHSGDVQVLKGRGMPKQQRRGGTNEDADFGDLYIQYKVEMPKSSSNKNKTPLTTEELKELRRLLSKLQPNSKSQIKPNKEAEILSLSPAVASDFGRASGSVLDDDDHDDHDHLHGRGDDYGENFHPFASSGFFQGAGPGFAGGRFYSFGSNGSPFGPSPFGGQPDHNPYGDGEGEGTQCQQM